MSDSATSTNNDPALDRYRKPLDNPSEPKSFGRSDDDLAGKLDQLIAALPGDIEPVAGARFPRLTALSRTGSAAHQLIMIAAQIHHWSDERRVAEYLLRHLDEVRDGRRSTTNLVSAARCVAEMDRRRVYRRELPVSTETLNRRAHQAAWPLRDQPSVREKVVSFARHALDRPSLASVVWDRLGNAVVLAVELAAARAPRADGLTPLEGMRSDARTNSRLSTRLRNEFGDPIAARSLARLLTGCPGAPLATSLLWWATRADADPASIPSALRQRWIRDLADADPAAQARRPHRRRSPCGAVLTKGTNRRKAS